MNKSKSSINKLLPVIFVITIFSLIGLVVDYFVSIGIYWCKVKKIADLCFGLIQIQATLASLTIAITALLSGLMSKSYFGISVVSFVLNVKTWFNFKSILLSEFLLLLISIIWFLYEKYNTVFIIFTVSMLLILNLTLTVCSVFLDSNSIKSEVLEYFKHQVQSNSNYKDIGDRFINDWKKAILNNQSQEEYDKHFDLFLSILKRILIQDKYTDTETVNSFLEKMALFLLKNENFSTRIKGVFFVINFYKELYEFVNSNEIKNGEIKLISKVKQEWCEVLKSLDIEYIEKNINIRNFMENVLFISCSLGNNTESETIYYIAGWLGTLLEKISKEKQDINFSFWSNCILRYPHKWNVKSSIQSNYLESRNFLNYYVCYGYLLHGYSKLVKEALFPNDNKNYIVSSNENNVYNVILELMLVHCFMYYLAYHSNSQYRSNVLAIVADKTVIKQVHDIYKKISFKPKLLTSQLKEKIELTYSDKSIVLGNIEESIGRFYFLYVAIWALEHSKKTTNQQNVSQIIDLFDVEEYRSYLYESRHETIIDALTELGKNIESGISDKTIEARYNIFCSEMKRKYKDKLIFDTNNDYTIHFINKKDDIQNAIKEKLNKSFSDKFKIINSSTSKNSERFMIYVPHMFHYTSEILQYRGDSLILDLVWRHFIRELITNLKNHGYILPQKNREKDYDDDSKLRKFIKDNRYNLLIGDISIFQCKYLDDTNKYYEHERFMNDLKKIDILDCEYLIAINYGDINICLNKIAVNIDKLTDERITIYNDNYKIFTPKDGIIVFHEFNELQIDFNENEFFDFISKYIQDITISFDVSVEIKKNKKDNMATIFNH